MSESAMVIEIEGGRVEVETLAANEAGPWPPTDRVMLSVVRDLDDGSTFAADAAMSPDQARELMDTIAVALGSLDEDGSDPEF